MVVCEPLAQWKVIKGTGQAMFRGLQPLTLKCCANGKVAILKCCQSAFTHHRYKFISRLVKTVVLL